MAQTQENMEIRGGPGEVNGRRSEVWSHFVISKDGEGKDMAICKTCEKTYGAETRNGTTHLKRHMEKGCTRPPKQPRVSFQAGEPSSTTLPGSSQAPPAQGSFLNQEECGTELARMIAFHGYPSSIVDDECFRSFVRGLNPQFQMPSRAGVEGIFHSLVEDTMKQLKETLARCSGQISLATGTAETGQGRALYMACQFIDDEWAFQKRILQVFKVVKFPPYNHSALLGVEDVCLDVPEEVLEQFSLPRTSGKLGEAVERWSLPGRIFSVAWGQEVGKRLERQDFLDDLCPEIKTGEGAIESPVAFFIRERFPFLVKPAATVVTYTSDVLDSAAAVIHKAIHDYIEEGCFNTFSALQLSYEQRAGIFSELGLTNVGRYDNKRWYSLYCALELLHKEHSNNNPALSLEEGTELIESQLTEILARTRVSRENQRKLRDMFVKKPRHKESLFTDLLRKILGALYRAIESLSSPTQPTSSLCLQELIKVRDVLQFEAREACQNVSKVRAYFKSGGFGSRKDADVVLLEAQGELNKFLEGDSFLYLSVPAVLDPRFKLEYVTSVCSNVFEPSVAAATISKVKQKIEDMFGDYSEGTSSMMASAAPMDVDSTCQKSTTELEGYLLDGVVHGEAAGNFDVLQWWKDNEFRYPTVARMARDALAMPASDHLSPEHLSCIRSMATNY